MSGVVVNWRRSDVGGDAINADAARNAHHRRDGCTQFEDVNFLPEQEARIEIMTADRRACERFDQMTCTVDN